MYTPSFFVRLKYFGPITLLAWLTGTICFADRHVGLVLFPRGDAQALCAHFFGFIAVVLGFYGTFLIWVHDPNRESKENFLSKYADHVALYGSLALSLIWEFDQAFFGILSHREPRGYVQCDQITVDFFGVVIGFLILRRLTPVKPYSALARTDCASCVPVRRR